MPMPIEAKDIAVGDWSPNYGTVTAVKENKNSAGVILSYNLVFFNGSKLTNIAPGYLINIEQDGAGIVHDGMPDKSQVRSGLEEDHAKD